jgi:hypothetical protein
MSRREKQDPPVVGTCYQCSGEFKKDDIVLVHKKYPDAAAFHDICRSAHKDYVVTKWPATWPVKAPARSEST